VTALPPPLGGAAANADVAEALPSHSYHVAPAVNWSITGPQKKQPIDIMQPRLRVCAPHRTACRWCSSLHKLQDLPAGSTLEQCVRQAGCLSACT